MGELPVAAFLSDSPKQIARVYGSESLTRLRALARLREDVLGSRDLQKATDVQYLFSTWGMPSLDEHVWRSLPNLRAVFYAAGSVKAFAKPLLTAGPRLFSAWEANAQPVAEYCLGQILLAGKGFLPSSQRMKQQGPAGWTAALARGNRHTVVSVLGAGKVGRALIQLLVPFPMRLLVFDPFLSEDAARALGAEKVDLDSAFAQGHVVTNHLADVPETKKLINARLLGSMRQNALFLNTGRGTTVDEAALLAVMKSRPDLYAVLDVFEQEPPPAKSQVYSLPNVFPSPHIAGSLGTELEDMALAMVVELEALLTGKPLRAEVTADMLATMA